MLTELGRTREENSEKFHKETENIRKFQTGLTELKNTTTELKNTLVGINSRLSDTEEQMSDLEDRVVEISKQNCKKKKRIFKNEDRACLVAQWLRICLPMQGTRVRALVWEDRTCRRTAGPVSHNY